MIIGYTKDFVLDRGHLERLGSSPPKLISLTEARARLKENNKISEPEQKVEGGNFFLPMFLIFSIANNMILSFFHHDF